MGSSPMRVTDLQEKGFPLRKAFFCYILLLDTAEFFSTCTVEITQYALKGQKLLAQGIALGNYERKPVAL